MSNKDGLVSKVIAKLHQHKAKEFGKLKYAPNFNTASRFILVWDSSCSPAETKAIKSVFGEHVYNLNISSTKSQTGHLLGGAGAIEGLASVLSVYHNVVPPTINHFTDDPEIDSKLNLTFNVAQHRIVNAALSNTFGFGGHNASVIFKKFVD